MKCYLIFRSTMIVHIVLNLKTFPVVFLATEGCVVHAFANAKSSLFSRCQWRDHRHARRGGTGRSRGGQRGWVDPCPQEQRWWRLHSYILRHHLLRKMTDTWGAKHWDTDHSIELYVAPPKCDQSGRSHSTNGWDHWHIRKGDPDRMLWFVFERCLNRTVGWC